MGDSAFSGPEFDIYKISWIQEKLYIDAKIRENNIFWSKNNAFSWSKPKFRLTPRKILGPRDLAYEFRRRPIFGPPGRQLQKSPQC